MFLVVDFTDLDLEFVQTDIRLDDSADITAGKLIGKLCDGMESLGGVSITQRGTLELLDPGRRPIDASRRIGEVGLENWSTVYLVRRGSR